MDSRIESIQAVTKKLIILSLISLIIIGLIFGASLLFDGKIMITWVCVMCGILGGFVSIQQRLKKISTKELQLLSKSWFQILLVPIYGGIFSLLLYVIFLSDLISGHFFPVFNFPTIPESGVDSDYMQDFFANTYPATGPDFAKLIFWCFLAGFSERLVPQIISNLSTKFEKDDTQNK